MQCFKETNYHPAVHKVRKKYSLQNAATATKFGGADVTNGRGGVNNVSQGSDRCIQGPFFVCEVMPLTRFSVHSLSVPDKVGLRLVKA